MAAWTRRGIGLGGVRADDHHMLIHAGGQVAFMGHAAAADGGSGDVQEDVACFQDDVRQGGRLLIADEGEAVIIEEAPCQNKVSAPL